MHFHKVRRVARGRRIVALILAFFLLYILCVTILESSGTEDAYISDELIRDGQLISARDGYVFLMFFNSGYLDFMKSWMCNILLVDPKILNQTLFVAANSHARLQLQSLGHGLLVHTLAIENDGADVSYGTYEYFDLTLQRLQVQNRLLQKGVNVFVIEADAVWFSPFVVDVDSAILKSQIISARDRGGEEHLISAGFLFVPSSRKRFFDMYVRKYASKLSKLSGLEGRIDDIDHGEQHLMTKMLAKSRQEIIWLDECDFARGEWYTSPSFRMTCAQPRIIQNNYIVGNENKVRRAHTWGHWFVDERGSCRGKIPPVYP